MDGASVFASSLLLLLFPTSLCGVPFLSASVRLPPPSSPPSTHTHTSVIISHTHRTHISHLSYSAQLSSLMLISSPLIFRPLLLTRQVSYLNLTPLTLTPHITNSSFTSEYLNSHST